MFGARLRITALRAAAGPGIEFLEYLAPGDGRPRPPDLRPNDLAHWQTQLVVRDVAAADAAMRRCTRRCSRRASSRCPRWISASRRGSWLADPDGHQVALVH